MAIVSERPLPQPHAETRHRSRLLEWITTVDHKKIGILYLVTTAVFLVIGGIEALVMRTQLAVPRADLVSPGTYNALFTMHGTTMIFLVVMPMLLGFANYMVPLMIGARDMAFPRLNALSYWLLLFGGIVLYFSFLHGTPPNQGWFAYSPLTEPPYTLDASADYWALGLLITSIGTIATGINLVATVVKLRVRGMTPSRIPVFVWMSLITAFIILWAIPSLTAAQVMLLFDRHLDTQFFRGEGDQVLWQHLFWFFGHPEVYIMVLPAFGMISEIVPVFSRKPLFGYRVVVGSGVAIAVYSFMVWAHHMFAVGLDYVQLAFFGAASMLIAVPTGIKIFSWLATMWGGRLRLTPAMLFCIGFIAMFTIGGISGVHFAIVPVDWQTTDTYYVVAHMHYVLFGGTFFGMVGAVHYWFPKMSGRMLSDRLGYLTFWLLLIGFNLTFFPMHILGLMGMPRRVYTYPDRPWWGTINFIETIGAYLMGLAVLLLIWNIVQSLRAGRAAGDNPWDAWTLEWATSSPPPDYNFATLPAVASARPLWDVAHREQPATGNTPTSPDGDLGEGGRGALAQIPTNLIGTLAFISSEVVFFGALIVTFIMYRTRSTAGPRPEDLDVLYTAIISVALFASSGTIILAERRLARADYRGFRLWLVATIALGAAFLTGQIIEYVRLYDEGITIGDNLFTSAFFTLTGFHGLHVGLGLVALIIVAALAFRRGDRARPGDEHTGIRSVAIYWHFVDLVWVVLFSLIYLWALL